MLAFLTDREFVNWCRDTEARPLTPEQLLPEAIRRLAAALAENERLVYEVDLERVQQIGETRYLQWR